MNLKTIFTPPIEGLPLDLANEAGFTNISINNIPSLDLRKDKVLIEEALSGSDPVERERAVWEYCYREYCGALPFLQECFIHEPDASVRSNMLWLAMKIAGSQAHSILRLALSDEHREVRDWAKLYLEESTGEEFDSEYSYGKFRSGMLFDQTLPLQISGYALMTLPTGTTVRAILSPAWFAALQGRVMACTNRQTFMTDLIIEKCIFGYHPDGTNHYEIYPFSGYSWEVAPGEIQHRYMSNTKRPFYRSGRVEENSFDAILTDTIVSRSALTSSTKIQVFCEGSLETKEMEVVKAVRGQFFGWAHTSLNQFARNQGVAPGTVQLVAPTATQHGIPINTYLCGSFRGKISDHDSDGLLDVNTIPCHGDLSGNLDYLADGTYQPDPYEAAV